MIYCPAARSLKRHSLVAALVVGGVLQPLVAHAQIYDPETDAAPNVQTDGRTSPQNATQQTSRTTATSQLSATAAPQAQFRTEDVISNSRAQAQPRNSVTGDEPPVRDRPIVASEFETYASEIVDKPLLRFGSTLLVPNARGFTAPSTTAVPPDYRLNPGDELIVGLTGAIQADGFRATVDPEGRIFLPRIGAVNVGGVRYADVNSVITAQVSRQYRDFRVAVTLGQLHGITIYITGFAATPGSYTVSSLSTLVNGVLAAGGPTTGGSFRTIELRRGGRTVSTFDLYDLLLRGDKSADVVLQNGDVIFIGPAGAQVAAIGSVNNEAIYETKPGDSLDDVLRYAGGGSTVAEQGRVLVLDSFQTPAGGWVELPAATLRAQPARRGQILRVLSGIGLVGPVRKQSVLVSVSGEVARPGRYFLTPGVTVADVLAQAGGLTAQAYPFATVFTRESVRQQQRVSFQRAIADLEFMLTAQPLTSALDNLTIQPSRLQAISSVVAQLKARKPDGRLVFDLAPTATTLPGTFVIENNDSLFVPPVPVTVGVFGAVPTANSFVFTPGATIGSFLSRAGGVQPIGDRSHIFVIRANGSLMVTRHGHSEAAIRREPALPGDLIFVPINARRGEFFAKIRELTGAVFTAAFGGAAIGSVTR